jgi:L-lactate dehydrogenase complex protein LldG
LSSREKILNRVKHALSKGSIAMPFPEAAATNEHLYTVDKSVDIAEYFAASFTNLGGRFIYCANEIELLEQLTQIIHTRGYEYVYCNEKRLHAININELEYVVQGPAAEPIDAAITTCEAAVARLGSLVINSNTESGRALSVYAPIHICVVFATDLVWDINDAIQHLHKKYGTTWPSMINLATGPSRTADIEKTLVVGVHGPKEVFVLFLDKEK